MSLFYRLAALSLLCAVAACSQLPTPGLDGGATLTPQAFGTPQNDEVLALASYSGGVYAVGETQGSLYAANRGSSDIFITKIGSDKRTVWSRQFGTPGSDYVSSVAVDAGGNVYVFGRVSGRLARNLGGDSDFFLRKYGASGGVVWTLQFGLETGDNPFDLVATSNSVYVVGSSDAKGLFLYRFNLNGNIWWKRQLRVPSDTFSFSGLTLDSAGNAYVAGSVRVERDPVFETEGSDIRLYKFSGAGALLWTKDYNFALSDSVSQVVARSGSVFLNTVRFDIGDDESYDVIVSVTGSGALRWERYSGVYDSYDGVFSGSTRLMVDGAGVYIDTVNVIDPPGEEAGFPSRERALTKYRLDGSPAWERDWFPVGTPLAVAERGAGDLYVGGYTGSRFNPDVPSDALVEKLNAATGARVWSK